MKAINIILLIVLNLITFAQADKKPGTLDSLKAELKNASVDSIRVNVLHDIGAEYLLKDIDEALEWAEKGLSLANKIGFKQGVADNQSLIANIYWRKGISQKAIEYYEDNIKIYNELNNLRGEIRNLNDLSRAYSSFGKVDSALILNKNAVELSKKLDNKIILIQSLFTLGGTYSNLSEIDSAFKVYDEALKVAKEINDKFYIALILGDKGIAHENIGNFSEAMKLYHEALSINEEIDFKPNILANLINISVILLDQKDYEKSNEYLHKADELAREMGEVRAIPFIHGNKAINYRNIGENDSAEYYFKSAIEKDRALGNKKGVARHINNYATLLVDKKNYEKSKKLYEESIKINEEIRNKNGLAAALGRLGNLYLDIFREGTNIDKGNDVSNEIRKSVDLQNALNYTKRAINYAKEIDANDMLINWYGNIHQIYNLLDKNDSAYRYFGLWSELKDSIFNVEKSKEIANLTAVRDNSIKDKELEIKDLEIVRSRNERIILIAGLAFVIIVVIIIYGQRRRSEHLLLNILPKPIAKRLKAKEQPIADHFEEASVIFIDIVGFTKMSAETDPDSIVELLNNIFTKLDKLAEKYGLEKIKTIGDCFMAVSGIPISNTENAKNIAEFALEVKEAMNNYKTKDGKLIKFRIGIDCGAVVAGVIGSNKFIYDLWGDTVNTASHMETYGMPGEIQVTDRFRDKLSNSFDFEKRGEIEIKGKGPMNTFYLKGKKDD